MKVITPSGFFYFVTTLGVAGATPVYAAGLSQPAATPPPPVLVAPPPAPTPVSTRMQDFAESPEAAASRIRALQEVVTLDVEVIGGSERLWLGSLRVINQQSSEYTATLSQAKLPCPGTEYERGYGNSLQDRLNLSLQRRDWNRDIDGFYVRISWTHPRESCGSGAGQATVGFDQSFNLRPGESKQLTGDGGLVVKLTRRR